MIRVSYCMVCAYVREDNPRYSLTLIRSAIGWSVVHVCDVAFPGHTHLLFQYLLAHMITRLLKGPK